MPYSNTVPWFGMPDAIVDQHLDELSDAACKFLLLLYRSTGGYKSYQDNPAPVRLSTREIGKGRTNKSGATYSKGTRKSKHTIIRVVRECQDMGMVYVEEDRSDLARIEKKYAPLQPGASAPTAQWTASISKSPCGAEPISLANPGANYAPLTQP